MLERTVAHFQFSLVSLIESSLGAGCCRQQHDYVQLIGHQCITDHGVVGSFSCGEECGALLNRDQISLFLCLFLYLWSEQNQNLRKDKRSPLLLTQNLVSDRSLKSLDPVAVSVTFSSQHTTVVDKNANDIFQIPKPALVFRTHTSRGPRPYGWHRDKNAGKISRCQVALLVEGGVGRVGAQRRMIILKIVY